MPRATLLLAAAVLGLTGCRPPNSAPTPGTPAQPHETATRSHATREAVSGSSSFDFYLLNLSWSPDFCRAHPGAAECARHSTFVLHGLWPERSDGSYPEHCSNAPGPADPSQYSDIYPDPGLISHEWQTHGTCSGLSPADYFAAARAADQQIKLPSTLTALTTDISLTPDQIATSFQASNPSLPRASLVVSCGNNYLTAVEVCLSKTLQPVSCGAVRSCRAQSVHVTAP